ncbi:MAG: ATP-binding protein [bacterium]
MSLTEKTQSRNRPVFLVHLLVIFFVVALMMIVGNLTTNFLQNQAAQAEAGRISAHVRLIAKRNFPSEIWENPSSPQSAAFFKKLAADPMLVNVERLREVKIWLPDGRIAWGADEKLIGKRLGAKGNDARAGALRGAVTFEFEAPGHDSEERAKYGGSPLLETYIPVWREGGAKGGRPDLIVEVYTEPRFLFKHLRDIRIWTWSITGVAGLAISLVMLGVGRRIGRLSESVAQSKRAETINEITRAVASFLEPEMVFRTIVREIRRAIPCERCVISSVDPETNEYHNWYVESDIDMPLHQKYYDKKGLWWHQEVYENQRPVNVPDILEIPRPRPMQLRSAGFRSVLVAPILQGDKVVAHLSVASTLAGGFTAGHEEMLTSIARHIGPAIWNARLYEEMRESREFFQTAKENAEAANNAKNEFLANLSHELRSPLNSVIGYTDLLLKNSADEWVELFAPKIQDGGKYLLRLIEDLLDFDRISGREVRMNPERVDINDLVGNVLEKRLAGRREGIEIRRDLAPTECLVSCDPTRIEQVLINLLDNAVRYSPEGGAVTVRTQARGGEVWVSVVDEGMGMSPDEAEAVFERFHQVETGSRREFGGLGIGLSIARELVELHDGRIWAESEKGCGSAFTFALPLAEAETPDTKIPEPAAFEIHSRGGEEAPWDGLRVLLVDDIAEFHEFMKFAVRSAARLLSAYNGEEGLETARRERPDLILMDLRMPVLDGFDAIRLLKGDPLTQSIPVVAISAFAMQGDKERALGAGADGYVTKPVDLVLFKEELRRLLAKV